MRDSLAPDSFRAQASQIIVIDQPLSTDLLNTESVGTGWDTKALVPLAWLDNESLLDFAPDTPLPPDSYLPGNRTRHTSLLRLPHQFKRKFTV